MITVTPLGPADRARPLLVLGPSLGTSAAALWGAAAQRLASRFHVVAWDLPGHGAGPPVPGGYGMAELATGVLGAVESVLDARGEPGGAFAYAGDSIGGAVGLQLMLDHPARVTSAVLLCTGARIGTAQTWAQRVAQVRAGGTAGLVEASVGRWFGPGFTDRDPDTVGALVAALRAVDVESYAAACDALAASDVRDRLAEITVPVLAVAGSHDIPTPVANLREIADGVADGWLVVLDGVAHLAPAEAPADVARLITAHCRTRPRDTRPPAEDPHTAGMGVRRAVLGDAYVDRATAAATDLTRDFQDLVTRYAWGTIWTRPGLDRRTRSMLTITALVARGHHEELALHLRAALRGGVTVDEIREVLLHAAIYCGVPDANAAFRVAQRVLDEPG